MAIKSFRRYEKKFMLTHDQYNALIPKLLEYMEPDKYCTDGKTYQIFNIYYDTTDNHVIRHSISKPYYKEKLRLRSYKTPTHLSDEVFLELKKKINGIVTKRRVTLTLEEALRLIQFKERPSKKDYIGEQVLNEIMYYLNEHDIQPSVYISYIRNAYFAKDDKNFRLTFDSHITTRRDHLNLQAGSFGKELLHENQYLMEVKILGAIPLWFTHILSELKIYNTHFSKYGQEYMAFCQEQIKRREEAC